MTDPLIKNVPKKYDSGEK